VSGNGDVLVVFQGDAGIWAQRLERGADAFTPPVRISGDRFGDTLPPMVAMDDHGNGIAAWTAGNGGSLQAVIGRRFDAAGGWPSGWGPEETITDGDGPYLTRLSMAPSGHAAASWMRGSQAAAIAVFEAGRGWQPPVAFPAEDPYVLTIDARIAEDGGMLRVIAAGMAATTTFHGYIVGAVYRHDLGAHAGRFDAPVAPLGKEGVDQMATAIGVDGSGNAMLGVFEFIGGDERFAEPYAGRVYVVCHAGAWGAAQLVYDGPGRSPVLAVSRGGDAVLTFLDHQSGAYQVSMRRFVGGTWQPAVIFAEDSSAQRFMTPLAIDGHGDVFGFVGLRDDAGQVSALAVSRFGPQTEWSAPEPLPFEPAAVPYALTIGPYGPAIAIATGPASAWQVARSNDSLSW
jgi:hypothetical protein